LLLLLVSSKKSHLEEQQEEPKRVDSALQTPNTIFDSNNKDSFYNIEL